MRFAIVLAALGLTLTACADDSERAAVPGGSSVAPDASSSVPSSTTPPSTAGYLDLDTVLSLESPNDGPFYEVTLLRYADAAVASDYDHEAFLPDGAEVVYSAPVERQLQGDTEWDLVEVVFWPSREIYVDTVTGDEFATEAQHRDAGVAETHVAVATPVTPISEQPLVAGEEVAPPLPADVPFPAEGDDEPFVLVAAVSIAEEADYEDGRETDLTGEEALDEHYEGASSGGGADLGIRPVMWMDVETTLAGDADQIESIRFNWWPSHATFDEVVGGGNADTTNRTAGLENSSTMITNPEIDTFSSDDRVAVADIDAGEIDAAPLFTEQAVTFLVAADEFQSCLEEAGWGWQGEPGQEGVPDDEEYLLALGGCQGDSDVAALLLDVFLQPDDAPLVTDVEPDLLTDAAIESLTTMDRFIGCLDATGFGWQGSPTAADAPDDPAYQGAVLGCITEFPVQSVLDDLLTEPRPRQRRRAHPSPPRPSLRHRSRWGHPASGSTNGRSRTTSWSTSRVSRPGGPGSSVGRNGTRSSRRLLG